MGIRLLLSLLLLASPVPLVAAADPPAGTSVTMTPAQLFAYADAARDAGDFATAQTAYEALATNPEIELRTEARFRLAQMLADRQHKYREAAVQLRKILDEKPKAARVRLELARMQALMGNLAAAGREMRAAEAAGLPPQVERMVRFYAQALSAAKPLGGSIEVALAPDSNINRATKSDTLGTVIGDFTLDQNARARSGLGLALRGQGYARLPAGPGMTLLARLSGSADLYRASQFDDWQLAVQAGPEYRSGRDKIAVALGPGWRWYGRKPYTMSYGGSVTWQHPLNSRTQLRAEGGITHVNNRRNDLQDAELYSASLALDRAFSARAGGGLQLNAAREDAADPGYSTASGGASLYVFRELGRTTALASLGYSRLEADARLALYPRRRIDDRFSASLTGTFRNLTFGTFAPYARVRFDYNRSTIELYDYKRISGEFGLTAAF